MTTVADQSFTEVDTQSPQAIQSFTKGGFDADVHPTFRNGIRDLAPYVDDAAMRHRMGFDGSRQASVVGAAGQVILPNVAYVNPGGALRTDANPPDGGPPGSDPNFVITDHLDRHGLAGALLIGSGVLGIGGLTDPELAVAFAAAHNRWLEDVWLKADPRFRAAMVVAPQDPREAAIEIERWANDSRVAAIFLPQTDNRQAFGKRYWYPIYEAAEHFGTPVITHPGGESAGANGAMVAVGTPTYYMEFHACLPQVYQAHLISPGPCHIVDWYGCD